MRLKNFLYTLSFLYGVSVFGYDLERDGVKVLHQGKRYIVKRIIPDACKKLPINNDMLWTGNYASPKVPKECKSTFVHTKGRLLPMHLQHDIETYGELEVLQTLKKMQTDKRIVLIDARLESYYAYMTIPGAINMPFLYFKYRHEHEFEFEYAMKYLGATKDKEGDWDFDDAKTIVLFCNGPWCSQSPGMIQALLDIGYPEDKIKWYRGGLQEWLSAGMTTTRDEPLK